MDLKKLKEYVTKIHTGTDASIKNKSVVKTALNTMRKKLHEAKQAEKFTRKNIMRKKYP
ncbi:hypothetical protein [Enterocloster bolteae]|uniref:hypothetical protein n=1 Tax=Enterocloster bolteae TaxID=208479 RepID=UPI0039A27BEC